MTVVSWKFISVLETFNGNNAGEVQRRIKKLETKYNTNVKSVCKGVYYRLYIAITISKIKYPVYVIKNHFSEEARSALALRVLRRFAKQKEPRENVVKYIRDNFSWGYYNTPPSSNVDTCIVWYDMNHYVFYLSDHEEMKIGILYPDIVFFLKRPGKKSEGHIFF